MELWNVDYFDNCKNITVIVNNKYYKLHSIFLFVSDFIKTLYSGNFKEGNDFIEIQDISNQTWELFLNYLYSDITNGFMKKYKNKNIETVNLNNIKPHELITLMSFTDKILVPSISSEIFEHLWNKHIFKNFILEDKNIFEEILNNIDTKNLQSKITVLYHTQLWYDNPNFILPEFHIQTKKWNIDFNIYVHYPKSLYYILTLLTQFIIDDRSSLYYVQINFLVKDDKMDDECNKYSNRELIKIMKRMGVEKNVYSQYISIEQINMFNTIEQLLSCIFDELVEKYIDTLKIIYEENWRIESDNIIFGLLCKNISLSC